MGLPPRLRSPGNVQQHLPVSDEAGRHRCFAGALAASSPSPSCNQDDPEQVRDSGQAPPPRRDRTLSVGSPATRTLGPPGAAVQLLLACELALGPASPLSAGSVLPAVAP